MAYGRGPNRLKQGGSKMRDIAFILYSHTDYGDVWEAFFGQTEEYLPKTFNRYMFVDSESNFNIPYDFNVVYYKEQESYSNRVASCIDNIREEFCIFQHEDMMLYDKPNVEKIRKYLDVLKADEDLDFIKLLKGGDIDDEPYDEHKDLFIVKKWLFAVQPAIWKTDTLRKIFKHFKNKGIWDLEREAQGECRQMGVKGVYCYNGEQQRGKYHWDSTVYPYIATAINKGRWNMIEYENELEEIFSKYNIDRLERGLIK